MSAKPLVIANPASRGGRGRARWQAAAAAVAARLGPHDLVWTAGPGDAERIARSEARSRPLLVAFGGDGTASEVARGLAEGGANAELGLLPCGTGNDFAADLGIPPDIPGAARVLTRFRGEPTDMGRVEDEGELRRAFLNSLSVGLAASVAARVAAGGSRLGRATYAAAAAREIVAFAPRHHAVGLDDSPVRPRLLLNLSVLNTRRFGGGIRLAPPADPADGRLDAVLIGPLGPLRLLGAVRGVALGTHLGRREIEHRQIRQATVRPLDRNAPALLELDGELLRTRGALRITVVPGAVRIRRDPSLRASAPYREA